MTVAGIVAGITDVGLNGVLADLFKNPTAQQKLFNGKVTKDISNLGSVTAEYGVLEEPVVTFVPPTQAQWDAAHKISQTTPKPNMDMYGLSLPKNHFKMTSPGVSTPLEATGAITVYGTFALTKGTLSLSPVALELDESEFSNVDKFIVNGIIIPQVLSMAQKMLDAIPLPALPDVGGVTFQPPVGAIIAQKSLAVATNMTSEAAPSLEGFTPPDMTFYAVASTDVLNAVLKAELVGQPFDEEDKTGPDAWYAAGRIKGKVQSLSVEIADGGVSVSAGLTNLSGYGELGGTGVGVAKAVMCPIGAAADAIANPKDWDKVISAFDVSYKPDPLPIPVSFKIAEGTDPETQEPAQFLRLSVGELKTIQVVAAPKWSGSVTGTVLAPAAAAFIDLLSVIFKGKIVNAILKKNAQNVQVYMLPPVEKTVEGITISLTVPNGTAATPFGTAAIVQQFGVSFS
ncbi:hypothetical protein [Gymnodinialimonas sp.]